MDPFVSYKVNKVLRIPETLEIALRKGLFEKSSGKLPPFTSQQQNISSVKGASLVDSKHAEIYLTLKDGPGHKLFLLQP